jgi:integrase
MIRPRRSICVRTPGGHGGLLIMSQKLTDKTIKSLEVPKKGNRITYDSDVTGFGCRVTAAGARAFVLNYRRRADGVERRYTIGAFPDWSAAAAREEAKRLKRSIDGGADPVGEHREQREAPTVNDLCDRFEEEHLPRKRPSTQRDYRGILNGLVRPALGKRKVASLAFEDIDALHRAVVKNNGPYRANRTAAVVSKMCSLAVQWRWLQANPARGVERADEHKRKRYLSAAELERLSKALAEHDDRDAADIFRLLLLTGARRGEVLSMRWHDVDLETGIWVKPGATTKQKSEHRVPLSAPARQLLAAREQSREWVFAGRDGGHRVEIKGNWARICKAAHIRGLRIHDLRHSYASQLASAGFSLPTIGALLGHTQPATTHRYAHLFDDPLRQATERVGAIIAGKSAADVVRFKRGARGDAS